MAVLLHVLVAATSFSSRHLVLQGASGGCDSFESKYWLGLKLAITGAFASGGTPFDTVACPATKAEEASIIQDLLQRQNSASMLIVAGILQPDKCFCGNAVQKTCATDYPAECPGISDDFSPYAASLAGGATHLFVEVAPDLAALGLNSSSAGSLLFTPNNNMSGSLAGREFCARTAGSSPRKIAQIYGPATAQHSWQRVDGFRALVESSCPGHVFTTGVHADWSKEQGEEEARKILLADASVTAFVCANDDMAIGVIRAANKVRVGGTSGLLIVSFDNDAPIQSYLKAGTVVATIDPLIKYANNGLPFSMQQTVALLAETGTAIQAPSLSTDAMVAVLGLKSAKIESITMPFVSDMQQYLIRELMATYDAATRPFEKLFNPNDETCDGTMSTTVEVQFLAETLHDIDEQTASYKMDGYLRLWWRDERLRFVDRFPGMNPCFSWIDLPSSDLIWKPDIYFDTSVATVPPFLPDDAESLLRLYSNGDIFWSRKPARLEYVSATGTLWQADVLHPSARRLHTLALAVSLPPPRLGSAPLQPFDRVVLAERKRCADRVAHRQ